MRLSKPWILQFALYAAAIRKAHASAEKLHEVRTSAVLHFTVGALHHRSRVTAYSNSCERIENSMWVE